VSSKQKSLIFLALSILLLIPGLIQPILKMQMHTDIKAKIGEFRATGLDKNRSILGTVKDLHEDGRTFVAFLILLFSVLVPFIKASMLGVCLYSPRQELKRRMYQIVNAIGKWSMADVFVVAILICYLSINGQGSEKTFEVTYLGLIIPVTLGSKFVSELGPGFYFFLGYCLISIASLHFFKSYMEEQSIQ